MEDQKPPVPPGSPRLVPLQQPVTRINVGDVVFFKEVTKTCNFKRDLKLSFKGGTGFGVMLGVVAPFGKMPTDRLLLILMGQAGYISFDDVLAFLGDELGRKCVKMFEDKYYPKDVPPPPPPSRLILPNPPQGDAS